MKTIGIIAEYNPFHNGHAYQIKKIREQTHADFCIVAMSGDFVQRGAPAIMDKYARTKMALSCGADLVVELPVLWATASAEDFAMAGVSLFDKMGCVNGLCFGAETDHLPLLSAIADVLVQEPIEYRGALSSYIKKGLNFPQARAKAILDYFHAFPAAFDALPAVFENQTHDNVCPVNHSAVAAEPCAALSENALAQVLGSPNNILALEYLKALRRRNSSITPYLIKREGAGYHESAILPSDTFSIPGGTNENLVNGGSTVSFHDDAKEPIICASATAIRKILLSGALAGLSSAMPAEALTILSEYCCASSLVCADDFSSLLNYRLLMESSDGFERFFDCNADISNRLYKNRYQFLSFEQFCELNKSRDITYTRMSRILTHILLGLTNSAAAHGRELDFIPYFRLLGFRRNSSQVLSAIKAASCIPIISKLADAKKLLEGPALKMLEQDIFAGEQVVSYKHTSNTKTITLPRSEYTREIVLL